MQTTTRPSATVIALHRSRAEKQALFAGENDVEHERRRAHRLLDGLTWYDMGAIILDGVLWILAFVGFAAILSYGLGGLRAGWWL